MIIGHLAVFTYMSGLGNSSLDVTIQTCNSHSPTPKGVYPQSDGGLAIIDIDASKGFVDLWVHLTFAIFANFDFKKQLKLLSTKI